MKWLKGILWQLLQLMQLSALGAMAMLALLDAELKTKLIIFRATQAAEVQAAEVQASTLPDVA